MNFGNGITNAPASKYNEGIAECWKIYGLSRTVRPQWSQLLGRGLEPMGWAGQAFSPGPRYKPMWLAPNTI
jgi:hypothetical protein